MKRNGCYPRIVRDIRNKNIFLRIMFIIFLKETEELKLKKRKNLFLLEKYMFIFF